MAHWKVQNFVPDSEDEEDICSNDQDPALRSTHSNDFVDIDRVLGGHGAECDALRSETSQTSRPPDRGKLCHTSEESTALPQPPLSSPPSLEHINRRTARAPGSAKVDGEHTRPSHKDLDALLEASRRPLAELFTDDVKTGNRDAAASPTLGSMSPTSPSSVSSLLVGAHFLSSGRGFTRHSRASVLQPAGSVSPLSDLSAAGSTHLSFSNSRTHSSAVKIAKFEPTVKAHARKQPTDRSALQTPGHNDAPSTTPIVRRLRQRTAIQQRPYTVDDQRFKETAMSRGIDYFRYVEKEHGVSQGDATDSSDGEITSSRRHEDDPAGPSASRPLQDSKEVLQSKYEKVPNALNSSSPPTPVTLWDILIESESYEISPLPKRRKLAQLGPLRAGPSVTKRCGAEQSTSPDEILSKVLQDAELDTPPESPCRAPATATVSGERRGIVSSFTAPPQHPVEFRLPVGYSPVSPNQAAHRTLSTPGSNSEPSPRLLPAHSSGSVAEAVGDPEQDTQLKRTQRKIRGVLPASWLTMDRGRQNLASKQYGTRQSGPVRQHATNTARPLSQHGRTMTEDQFLIEISSESEASSISGPRTQISQAALSSPSKNKPNAKLNRQSYVTSWLREDDVMEDNSIDRMIPPKLKRGVRRSHPKSTSSRTRRSKVTDSAFGVQEHVRGNQTDGHGRTKTAEITAPHGSRIQERGYTRRRRRRQEFEEKLLSLLRAARSRGAEEPYAALRLAARSARSGTLRSNSNRARNLIQHLRSRGSAHPRAEPVGVHRHLLSVPHPALLRFGRPRPLQEVSGNRQLGPSEQFGTSRDLENGPESTFGIPLTGASNTRVQGHGSTHGTDQTARKSGQFLPTLQPVNPAPAHLEIPGSKKARHRSSQPAPNPLMHRFLDEFASESPRSRQINRRVGEDILPVRVSKKRTPRRVLERQIFPPPISPQGLLATLASPAKVTLPENEASPRESTPTRLTVLRSFGAEYSVSFGIDSLPDGHFFDSTTLLGSGLFAKCIRAPDLRTKKVPLHVIFDDAIERHWGPWVEAVASDFDQVFTKVLSILKPVNKGAWLEGSGCLVENLTRMIRYIAEHLSFLDAADCKSFLGRLTSHLVPLVAVAEGAFSSPASDQGARQVPSTFVIPVLVRVLLIATQCCLISKDLECTEPEENAHRLLVERLVKGILRATFLNGSEDLKHFTQQTALGATSRAISRIKAEAFTILLHVIESVRVFKTNVWGFMTDAEVMPGGTGCTNVVDLDLKWELIFSVLPLFDVNTRGSVEPVRRPTKQREGWESVKNLIRPVFEAYLARKREHGATFNAYTRTIFSRCFCLIDVWAWPKSEVIISMMFDFFAKTNLHHLNHEESSGSPAFLECLDSASQLRVDHQDRCFHIFLKILGQGLRKLRSEYAVVKLAGIAYRLIPNHGRLLNKNEELDQRDLDALRNHHDLLTVLYWALPSKARIRIDHIERLVDFENSHIEAGRISAKSWSNLVTYQLSLVGQPEKDILPLTSWVNEMLRQTIRLHKHARTEVEDYVNSTRTGPEPVPLRSSQEDVITTNQSRLEALLVEILCFVRQALPKASTHRALSATLPEAVGDILTLFDCRSSGATDAVQAALDVVLNYVEKAKHLHAVPDSQMSVGYLDPGEPQSHQLQSGLAVLPDSIHQAVHRLLSNAFGSDVLLQDSLLKKIVETWVACAHLDTLAEHHTWDTYIGPFGHLTWMALRDTEQTRRFTPFFFSVLVKMDEEIYVRDKQTIQRMWLESLVEREALIKFQHKFTTALLNRDSSDSLLWNLPFSRAVGVHTFDISETEFRERRKALLNSVFFNMQDSLRAAAAEDRRCLKAKYTVLLKAVMTAMKNNFLGLGSSPNATNAYVVFVQEIVEALQRQIADILSVDTFFTDPSSAFPLPVRDPHYVASKLRNYGLRLEVLGTTKSLFSFVQSISARAASEGFQAHFTEQLKSATIDELMDRRPTSNSLPILMLGDICTAYVDAALDSCGWTLASPVLMAVPAIVEAFAQRLDGTDEAGIKVVETTLMTLLWHIRQSVLAVLGNGQYTDFPLVWRMLAACLTIFTSALRPLDYIVRLCSDPWPLVGFLRSFGALGLYLTTSAQSQPASPGWSEEHIPPEAAKHPQVSAGKNRDTHSFLLNRIQRDLRESWRSDQALLQTKRNGTWATVEVELESTQEERRRFLAQAEGFQRSLASFPTFSMTCDDDLDYLDLW